MRWIPLALLIACGDLPEPVPVQGGPLGGPGAQTAEGQPAAGPGAPAPAGEAAPGVGGPLADAQAPVEGQPVGDGEAGPGDPGDEDPSAPRHLVLTSAGGDRELAEATFGCCKDTAYQPVYDGYLALTAAMAAQDDAAANAGLEAMRAAVAAAVALDRVDPPAKAELVRMDSMAKEMLELDLNAKRGVLMDLSTVAIIFARARAGGELKMVEAYCSTTGKAWLQSVGDVANPYAGSADAGCGAFR